MSWIDIGPIDTIPPKGARVIKAAHADIAVFRTALDEVFAINDRCPHKGGPLSQGIVFDNRVACPLHDWVIDLETGEATGPDQGCAGSYPVKVENGRVFLELAEPMAAKGGEEDPAEAAVGCLA
jgi:nitrite reductase (NADH) small subunit